VQTSAPLCAVWRPARNAHNAADSECGFGSDSGPGAGSGPGFGPASGSGSSFGSGLSSHPYSAPVSKGSARFARTRG